MLFTGRPFSVAGLTSRSVKAVAALASSSGCASGCLDLAPSLTQWNVKGREFHWVRYWNGLISRTDVTRSHDRVVGDKGYSSRRIRTYLRRRGIRFTIPRKTNERRTGPFNRAIYRERNRVERLINWISNGGVSRRGMKSGRHTIGRCGSLLRPSSGYRVAYTP